jgi:hypothetical protein
LSVSRFLSNLLIADTLCIILLLPTILVDLLIPESGDFALSRSSVSQAQRDTSSFLVLVSNSSRSSNGSQSLPQVISEFQLVEEGLVFLGVEGGVSWSCAFKKSLLSGISTASIIAALEIAVERYLAVVNPLHYHEFVTRNGVLFTSLIGSSIAIGKPYRTYP